MNNQKKLKRYAIQVRYNGKREVIDHVMDIMRSGDRSYKVGKQIVKVIKDHTQLSYEDFKKLLIKGAAQL